MDYMKARCSTCKAPLLVATDIAASECLACRSKKRSSEYNVNIARTAVETKHLECGTMSHMSDYIKPTAPVKSLEDVPRRKLNTAHINMRISEQLYEILKKRALEKDVSVSKLIRRILEAELMPKEG